jgi:glycosyltransferase involved in cell wall biosynthesis
MAHAAEPLISCLCVTRNRPEHLRRAIRCFLSQTYENKELIVVYPASDTASADCVRSFQCAQLKPHGIARAGATLGELRNFSIECAAGQYVCGWDDDDWHSPERLRRQFLALSSSKKGATVLARMFLYDSGRRQAYLSCERLWENSVMFDKAQTAQLGIRYPHLQRKEDYEFVNALIEENLLYPVYDATSYIYNITGSNTCDATHFHYMLKRSTALSEMHSTLIGQAIEMELSPKEACERMENPPFKASITYVRHSSLPRH